MTLFEFFLIAIPSIAVGYALGWISRPTFEAEAINLRAKVQQLEAAFGAKK